MSGSAKAGTTAERHTCEAAGSDRLNSARSSEARVRRIFFSLDKDLHGGRLTGLRPESCWNDCLTVATENSHPLLAAASSATSEVRLRPPFCHNLHILNCAPAGS